MDPSGPQGFDDLSTKDKIGVGLMVAAVSAIPIGVGYWVASSQEKVLNERGNETLGSRGSRAFVGLAAGSAIAALMLAPLVIR